VRNFVSYSAGSSLGPSLSSMIIYMLMAAVLVFRPEGLFPAAANDGVRHPRNTLLPCCCFCWRCCRSIAPSPATISDVAVHRILILGNGGGEPRTSSWDLAAW
jgi:hypothetical protein